MLSPNAVGSIDAIEYLSGASTEVRSEGSGPPLILLHGLQSDLTIWDGVCEHLRSVERTIGIGSRKHVQHLPSHIVKPQLNGIGVH
jgi:hypothetical protein